MMIRVVIAEPRRLLQDLLGLFVPGDIAVVAAASQASDLAHLCAVERPDVVISDVDFGDGSTLESVIDDIRASGARVVVVSDDLSVDRVASLLDLGVARYFGRGAEHSEVVEAVFSLSARTERRIGRAR